MTVRAALVVCLLVLTIEGPLASAQTAVARRTRGAASIAGRIIHADGTAAEGARVAVYAVREGAAAGIAGTAMSAYDGRYEITGLPAGRFIVGVTPLKAGGFGGDTTRPRATPPETLYPGVTDRSRAQPITVFDGVAAEGIDVWLAPAPQRFSISGRVFWPAGVEVTNVVIEYGGPDAMRRGIWYVSDPGGLFTLEGIAQGTYALLARADTSSGALLGLASTDVTLGPVEDVRLTLRTPGSIEGRVVIEGGAKLPLNTLRISPAHALLTLSPVYPVEDSAVSDDGRFTLPHLLGEYSLDVRGLPAGWRVRRVLRAGQPALNNHIFVTAADRAADVEIVVGTGST
jgi:hypothetical protein